jgi:MerR family mercuric resistance operon transcriptional regulator
MESLTIGQLARAANVHVETIRYYQRRGLLAAPGRPARGIRRYGNDAVTRLGFIRRAQQTGFTLEEVQQLIHISETPGCRSARDIAARKLSLVRSRMADLERMSKALTDLIAQCDAGRKRSCPIIEALAVQDAR